MKPKRANKSKAPRRVALHAVVKRRVVATLTPVPVGAKIQPWHWWVTDVLNMTEAERSHYHKHSCAGDVLCKTSYGTLFEVRFKKPLNAEVSHGSEPLAAPIGSESNRKTK